jgi:hypothetical protein
MLFLAPAALLLARVMQRRWNNVLTMEGGDKVIRRVRLAYATNGTLAGVNLVSRKFRRRIKRA